jgi:hypothetical protein
MQDIRAIVDGMAANTARAALRLMAQRPAVPMYLYYSPAIDGEWGTLAVMWDDESPSAGFELATGEPLPFNRDSVAMTAWMLERGGVRRLPICGD